jgi:hypothetical protein
MLGTAVPASHECHGCASQPLSYRGRQRIRQGSQEMKEEASPVRVEAARISEISGLLSSSGCEAIYSNSAREHPVLAGAGQLVERSRARRAPRAGRDRRRPARTRDNTPIRAMGAMPRSAIGDERRAPATAPWPTTPDMIVMGSCCHLLDSFQESPWVRRRIGSDHATPSTGNGFFSARARGRPCGAAAPRKSRRPSRHEEINRCLPSVFD